MNGVEIEKVRQIKEILRDSELRNLVAVFSRSSGDEILRVYISAKDVPDDSVSRTATLGELPFYNLQSYKGPVLGFTALDVVYDTLTKGPRFYPLAKLFRELGRADELDETLYNLACFLLRHGSENKRADADPLRAARLGGKVVELALPALLAKWPAENLVAIIAHDLERFLSGVASLIYVGPAPASDGSISTLALEDLPALPLPAGEWIVAFRDLSYFNPRIAPLSNNFLELRPFLRGSARRNAYPETLRRLAGHCFRKAVSDADAQGEDCAFSLACEYSLLSAEIDDLLAIQPASDFESFLATGQSRRYYRHLPEALDLRPEDVVENYSIKSLPEGLRRGLGARVFCYPALREAVETGGGRFQNLGGVLWNLGKVMALARASSTYAKDLIADEDGRERLSISLRDVADMATRACVVYGLSNPWDSPAGQHDQLLRRAYENLVEALERLRDSPEEWHESFRSVRSDWYRFYELCSKSTYTEEEEEEVLARVRRMVERGGEFLEESSELEAEQSQRELRLQAERCVLFGRAILELHQSENRPDTVARVLEREPSRHPQTVTQELYQAANLTVMTEMPSGLCYKHLINLRLILESLQPPPDREGEVKERIRIARKAAWQIEQEASLLFTQTHEVTLLRSLFTFVLDNTRRYIESLETSSHLRCDLFNESLTTQRSSRLTFQVRNVGAVAARNVKVSLQASNYFRVEGGPLVRPIGDLDVNQTQDVVYEIYPLGDQPLLLTLTLTAGREGEPKDKFEKQFGPLHVKREVNAEFQLVDNPYTSGMPIQQSDSFFGRSREVLNVIADLAGSARQNVVVRGPRRSGKTSLLLMVDAILKNAENAREHFHVPQAWEPSLNDMTPVFVDLLRLGPPTQRVESVDFFRHLLSTLGMKLGWDVAAINKLLRHFDDLRGHVLSTRVSSCLELVKQSLRPELQVVILLDEFDLVSEDDAVLNLLRPIIAEEQQWLKWVICTTTALFKQALAKNSPFFNIFGIIQLKELDRDTAKRLIKELSERVGLEFDDEAVNEIYSYTSGHPYFIQILCREIVSEVNHLQFKYVSYDVAAQVIKRVISLDGATDFHCRYLWQTATGVGQLILAILSRAREPMSQEQLNSQVKEALSGLGEAARAWGSVHFNEALRWLREITEAITSDDFGRFKFSRELFAEWFREKDGNENWMGTALNKINADAMGAN